MSKDNDNKDKDKKKLTNEEFQELVIKKLTALDKDVKTIKLNVEENTQILRALEHSAEVAKAERDKMNIDVAYIKGNIESIKKDVSTIEIVTSSNYADLAKLKAVK